MAPIRLALIGLSQSAKTSWASEAHLPYLLSEHGKARYQITALLNSSADAASRAIDYYQLGPDVKAYGSPHDLAADPDIDLVVCTTRVDVHYDTVKPSLEAGKDVFVEWPLAENVRRASELSELAKASGSRTLVGLQARVAPCVVKLKELVASGVIGKVLSSDIQAFTPGGGGYSMSEGLAYFLDKKVGGSPMTIALGHMTDYIHFVLGEYTTSHSHTQIQRPHQTIRHNNPPNHTTTTTTSDVPDLISIHGALSPSPHITPSASLTINFRTGPPPFPASTKPFVWTITGEKGALRISSQRGPFLNADLGDHPVPIELHVFGEEVKEIEWAWDEEWLETLTPAKGRNTAKLYQLWSEGRAKEAGVADFEAAVGRHARLDAMLW